MKQQPREAAAWVYQGLWRILVDWFRVPQSPPSLPDGSSERVQAFRPSEGFLRYAKLKFWVLCLLIDVILVAFWVALFIAWPLMGALITPLALAVIVLPDVAAYVAIHLQYDTTWYVLGDRSLRIRRGVWVIRETTLTYNNIQNVKVTQGPFERYFGIANVIVETAGGGGGGEGTHQGTTASPHVGWIAGVSNAAEIRDRIRDCALQAGAGGLEAAEDAWHGERGDRAAWTPQHLDVLREIAAALRGSAA